MLVLIVVAVLVCWWCSDEPTQAAPPATAPAPGPAGPYTIGGTGGPLPAPEQLDPISRMHKSHRLVPPPRIPCKGGPQ
jgi:hypothetical protein